MLVQNFKPQPSELEASRKGALRVKVIMPFTIGSSRAWFTRALFLFSSAPYWWLQPLLTARAT